jgi:arylsulfatase A-like enzyme
MHEKQAVPQAYIELCLRHGHCVDVGKKQYHFFWKGLVVSTSGHDHATREVVHAYWGLLDHFKQNQRHFERKLAPKQVRANPKQSPHKQRLLMPRL